MASTKKYIKEIFDNTQNKHLLKVTLKYDPVKKIGLYSTKHIKKGEVIAFYKLTVYNTNKYKSPTNNVYTFTIYNKNGNTLHKFIGDFNHKNIPEPIYDIPFWAQFANEPSLNQQINAEMNMNIELNYENRNTVQNGSTMVYVLEATGNIKPNQEILWYYGDDYERDYDVNVPKGY
jgi:hypothetical protein